MTLSERNTYNEILEWAYEKDAKGFSFKDFKDFLCATGIKLSDSRSKELFLELATPLEEGNRVQSRKIELRDSNALFHLTVEASFRHLERIELLEARKSSKSAVGWAMAALLLAALVGMVQIHLSFDCVQKANWLERALCSGPTD